MTTTTTIMHPVTIGARQMQLSVLMDDSTVHNHVLAPGEYGIGRGRSAKINLKNKSISRRHAILHVGPNRALEIEDLGSRNGTVVQGTRLEPQRRTAVAAGGLIQLGELVALVMEAGSDANTPTKATIDFAMDLEKAINEDFLDLSKISLEALAALTRFALKMNELAADINPGAGDFEPRHWSACAHGWQQATQRLRDAAEAAGLMADFTEAEANKAEQMGPAVD